MTEPKPKRKRVTVVCSNCKKRKMKCDRGKPACNKCVNANVSHLCFYEAPHWASETYIESRIHFGEVNNDSFASKSTKDNISSVVSNSERCDIESLQQELASLKRKVRHQKENEKPVGTNKNCETGVNFYKSYNSLEIKRTFSDDIKPFSDRALLLKDPYLRLSVFSTYLTFKPHNDPLMSYLKMFEGADISSFKEGMLLSLDNHHSKEEMNTLLNIIEGFAKEKDEVAAFQKQFLPNIFGASSECSYQDIIMAVQNILPCKDIYDRYIKHFVDKLHAHFALVNEDFFQRLEHEALNKVDQAGRFCIDLNLDWKMLPLLATVLIVLRISYSGMKMDPTRTAQETDLLENHPIKMESLTVSAKCLGHINIFQRMNEDVLVCLICMRMYLLFGSEQSEIQYAKSTDLLLNLIAVGGLNMGLHRDPSEFIQYANDPKMMALRRRLWALIIMISRMDMCAHGRFAVIRPEFILNTANTNSVPEGNILLGQLLKQLDCIKTITQLEVLAGNIFGKTSVKDIRKMISATESAFESSFSLDQMEENEGDTVMTVTNMSIYKMNMMYTLRLCMILPSVANYFEFSKTTRDPILFREFFMKSTKLTLKMACGVIKSLDGTYDKFIGQKVNFLHLRPVQYGWAKCSFLLLSFILRSLHTKEMLMKRLQKTGYPTVISEIEQSIAGLLIIVEKLLDTLKLLNRLAKNKLAVKYYSSLKVIIWLDHMINVIETQGFHYIVQFLKDLQSDTASSSALKKFIFESNGYDIKSYGLDELNSSNQMVYFSAEDINSLIRMIDSSGVSSLVDENRVKGDEGFSSLFNQGEKQTDFEEPDELCNIMTDTFDWLDLSFPAN